MNIDFSRAWTKWVAAAAGITVTLSVVDSCLTRLPNSVKPASMQYVDDSVSPIEQLSLSDAKKGITWGVRNLADENSQFPPSYIHEELCGNLAKNTEGYYRTYQRITGAKHDTEGDRCQ